MRGEGGVGLPCPLCRQPMIGVALSDRAEINVDACQHCHFIWFDAHEVDTLVPRQPEPVAPELPQKAREMLPIAESSVCPNRLRVRILIAPRPMNRGNRSPRSLECRSSSMHQKSSEDRRQHGCFELPSFAPVFLRFQICAKLFNVSD